MQRSAIVRCAVMTSFFLKVRLFGAINDAVSLHQPQNGTLQLITVVADPEYGKFMRFAKHNPQ